MVEAERTVIDTPLPFQKSKISTTSKLLITKREGQTAVNNLSYPVLPRSIDDDQVGTYDNPDINDEWQYHSQQ
jgi:hypothetical protein